MKITHLAHLAGFVALFSMVVGCAAQTEPEQGSDTTPVTKDGTPAPAPTPAPTPAPSPVPACKPIANANKGTGSVPGMANPASVYCAELGYQLAGEQCAFPDGTSCEQWAFFRGECGGTHSFCNLHGGTVSNKIENMGTWTASYAQCSLPNGKQCHDSAFAETCICE